jgi:hypothetical protein
MPAVNKDQALELLTRQVEENLGTDELLEVYNEVFPDDPCTEEDAEADSGRLVEQLADHVNSGLEIDEIMDLWRLILPGHRNLWYDEEEEMIHYNEKAETVPSE